MLVALPTCTSYWQTAEPCTVNWVHEGSSIWTQARSEGSTGSGAGSARWASGSVAVSPHGGPTMRLTSVGANEEPAWSPNGRQILFVSNRTGDHHLYVMPASGGANVQLTFGNYDDDQPAWSPDGSRVVFTSGRSGSDALWTMSAQGGAAVHLTNNPNVDDVAPAWGRHG